MSKPVKDLVTNEYKALFGDVDGIVVSVIGLDAISTNKLRGAAGQDQLKVVRTAWPGGRFGDGPLAPLAPALTGPCALVTGGSRSSTWPRRSRAEKDFSQDRAAAGHLPWRVGTDRS